MIDVLELKEAVCIKASLMHMYTSLNQYLSVCVNNVNEMM